MAAKRDADDMLQESYSESECLSTLDFYIAENLQENMGHCAGPISSTHDMVPVCNVSTAGCDGSTPEQSLEYCCDLFSGCLDNSDEALQLISELIDTEQEILDDLLPLPYSIEDHLSQENPEPCPLDLELLLSLPPVDLDSFHHHHALEPSNLDSEAILRNHPHFEALKQFIKARIQAFHSQKGSDCTDNVESVQASKAKEVTAIDFMPPAHCPETDQVMDGAIASIGQLSTDECFNNIMYRVENDCEDMLVSVGSFCKGLLHSARNDSESNKENCAPLSNSAHKPARKALKESAKESREASAQSKKRQQISKQSSEILRQWLLEHADNPYPDDDEKTELCLRTNLSLSKINQWFVNGRRRVLASVGLRVPKSKR